jgi:hypothetical protein
MKGEQGAIGIACEEIDGVALDFIITLDGVVGPVAIIVEDANLVFLVAIKPEVFDVQLVIDGRRLPFVVNICLAELPMGFFYGSIILIGFVSVVYLTCCQHKAADGNKDY